MVEVDPSPNNQYHDVGVLVEVSVKETVSGALPEVGVAVKLATGAITDPSPGNEKSSTYTGQES